MNGCCSPFFGTQSSMDGKDTKRCDTAKASSITEAKLMKFKRETAQKIPTHQVKRKPKTLKIVALLSK